ncbi:hypothetical protein GA0074695_2352 [Micromonospora viridifaciens]|uniref:Uncharacterized protein n=1 Tax=Micromonospora viridifaciens TaxID=1881 RepID=A0A1C4WEG4_MICVI|nr:hypothetical protein GA0074695_2352 [Micromonospora viridifaciens]
MPSRAHYSSPEWPALNSHSVPTERRAWKAVYPHPVKTRRMDQWPVYTLCGGIILLAGCLALLVATLST